MLPVTNIQAYNPDSGTDVYAKSDDYETEISG